jgi:hypothetical protein
MEPPMMRARRGPALDRLTDVPADKADSSRLFLFIGR